MKTVSAAWTAWFCRDVDSPLLRGTSVDTPTQEIPLVLQTHAWTRPLFLAGPQRACGKGPVLFFVWVVRVQDAV